MAFMQTLAYIVSNSLLEIRCGYLPSPTTVKLQGGEIQFTLGAVLLDRIKCSTLWPSITTKKYIEDSCIVDTVTSAASYHSDTVVIDGVQG